MLTKWGKKIVACAKGSPYLLPYVTVGASNYPALFEAKSLSGNTVYICPTAKGSNFAFISTSLVATGTSASYGVAVGSGTTPPTENDCTIEQQILGVSASTPSIANATYYDKTNNRYLARLDYSVANNSEASVTISEIALFATFYTAAARGDNASSSGSSLCSILIDRTLLASPVTIPAGSAATIRYEFAYDA